MDFSLLACAQGVIIVVIIRTDWLPEGFTGGESAHAFGEMFDFAATCDHLGIEAQNVMGVMPILANSEEAAEFALAELSDGVGGVDWHGNEPMVPPSTEEFDSLLGSLEKWANKNVKGDS